MGERYPLSVVGGGSVMLVAEDIEAVLFELPEPLLHTCASTYQRMPLGQKSRVVRVANLPPAIESL